MIGATVGSWRTVSSPPEASMKLEVRPARRAARLDPIRGLRND